MQTYYFDMKDGVPVRDRVGIEFATAAHAIEHSRTMARRFGEQNPGRDPNLSIIVLSENGTEIHRERVYPVVE